MPKKKDRNVIKVDNPSIQTAPPKNLSPGPYPSKDTFPEAGKKEFLK